MSVSSLMSAPARRLALAGLLVMGVAACASAPAAPIADPVPPPRRPLDAKTQLEYGDPPPVRRGY